jgi:hypothetical protein
LQYEYNTPVSNAFITIFRTSEQADDLINSSPVRYTLVPEPPATALPPLPIPQTEVHPSQEASQEASHEASYEDSAANYETGAALEKEFEIRASPSSYPHQKYIHSSPIHGPWTPLLGRRSRIVSDLRQRIPPSVAREGLCDWETEKAISRRLARDDGVQRERGEVRREERAFAKKFGKEARELSPKGLSGGGVPWRILAREKQAKEARRLKLWGEGGLRGNVAGG